MTTKRRRGRWDHLLENPDVDRWHKNILRSSKLSGRSYLGGLGRSLEAIGHTPESILELDQKSRDDAIIDIITHYESPPDGSPPKAPGTVHIYHSAVVSWLHWNGLPPKRKFKVTNRGWNPKAEKYNILTQDQVRRFYHAANPRTRVAGAFINFAGVRLEVLGWVDGSKGLCLKHLPELRITPEGFEVESVPMRVKVPRDLNKGRRAYTTFLGAQGIDYLLATLEARRNGGEELTPDSPVLTDRLNSGKFINTRAISRLIRRAFDKVGIPEPPYILKSVWMNRAIRAEADGFTSIMRTFCVGHAGTLAVTYGLRKELDPATLEQIRTAYAAALRHMETEAHATVEDPVRQFWAMVLQDLGDEAATANGLSSKSEQEIRDLVMQRFHEAQAASQAVQAPVAVTAARQEVVPLDTVSHRLQEGWRFVANLGDGTAVVEGS